MARAVALKREARERRLERAHVRALPGCAIRRNQAQSGAIRRNQVKLRALPGCVLRTRMHRAGPNRRGRLEGDRMQSEEIGGRLAGDRRQNQWQSEATSPARRQSEEAIRGHQRPSEATSPARRHRACTRRRVRHISAGADRQSSSPRHQLPSGAISSRGNQTQSDAIRGNRTHSDALERDHLTQSEATQGQSDAIGGH